jgi:peroxiredoxin
MALSKTSICDFGWKARDFALKGVDGKTYTLADVRGLKGTLVVFICNHCPYVKASIDRIVTEAKALREIGIGTIAIMPNDTATYREDSFDNMKAFAAKHDFTFPYVIDETQDVARAYDAQCTPDFFGFNAQDELQYRGRLDRRQRSGWRRGWQNRPARTMRAGSRSSWMASAGYHSVVQPNPRKWRT